MLWRRAAWISGGLVFGGVEGPLVSLLVGHWRPDLLTALITGPILAGIAALHVEFAARVMCWARSDAWIRVSVLIVLGGVLFMLPDSIDLPTAGDLWWTTGLERYFIAVTAIGQAPGLASQFPALFASVRHPSNAQIVAVGLAAAPSGV